MLTPMIKEEEAKTRSNNGNIFYFFLQYQEARKNDPESDEVEGYQVSVGLEGANVVNTPPGQSRLPASKALSCIH